MYYIRGNFSTFNDSLKFNNCQDVKKGRNNWVWTNSSLHWIIYSGKSRKKSTISKLLKVKISFSWKSVKNKSYILLHFYIYLYICIKYTYEKIYWKVYSRYNIQSNNPSLWLNLFCLYVISSCTCTTHIHGLTPPPPLTKLGVNKFCDFLGVYNYVLIFLHLKISKLTNMLYNVKKKTFLIFF